MGNSNKQEVILTRRGPEKRTWSVLAEQREPSAALPGGVPIPARVCGARNAAAASPAASGWFWDEQTLSLP